MGKSLTFFFFMWVIISIAGGVVQGSVQMASTTLTANITDASATIPVRSTAGFPVPGLIVIGEERIAYASVTASSFTGSLAQPIVRGAESTTATAHTSGSGVRTVEGSMMNQSVTYNISVIADASGLWAAVTIGLAILRLLGSLLLSPATWMGTDLMMISVLWWIAAAGLLVSIGLALAGFRRV